jgi:plasmid replication initiation protein
MRTEIKPLDAKELHERHVNMSNALTRAGHGLTLSEKRLIAACIAQNDSISTEAVTRSQTGLPCITRLSALDYAELYGLDKNTAYEQLQDGAKHLFERKIRIEKTTKRGYSIYECRWVGAARYHQGEGWIELHWWHEIVPHLYGLKDHFTTYKLKHASALRSAYSWRLFELLQSWKNKDAKEGTYAPTIEEFHHAMDAKPSHRANFKALRERIIEPAVAELINKNGLLIDWKPIKAGRKVTSLEFTFKANPQTSLF